MEIDHRSLAVKLYNRCWELLDLPASDPRNDELERSAFASLYHWWQIGDAKNVAIGEWMISHMYLALERYMEAERFADRVIELCRREGLEDFYLAYGYLEMARIKRAQNMDFHEWLGKARAVPIPDDDDRAVFEADLKKDGWL
jgi:hypothetical protein